MPVLSIIIPIYNVEQYLEECLESIVGIDNIEIILVNDCTPDNSMEIAAGYASQFNNITIINHEVNKGLGAARNTGIDKATGKYIFFLDSDDFLNTHELKLLVKTLDNVEYDQVLISFLRFDDEKGVYPQDFKYMYTKYDGKVLNRNYFKELVHIINLSQLRILKREKILSERLKFPDGLYEDVLWTYWYTYCCKDVLVLDNKIYLYRQRPESILSSTSPRHMELIEQYINTINFFKSKSVSQRIITILKNKFFDHVYFLLIMTDRLPKELRDTFYKKSVTLLKPVDYKSIKNIYTKKQAFKTWLFIHFGYKNILVLRDAKLLLNRQGIKALFDLLTFNILKFFPTSDKIWVFGSRFDKFTDNTKYFFMENLERSKKDSLRFIWISRDKNVRNMVKSMGGESYSRRSIKGLFLSLLAKYKFVNCWGDDIGFKHTANGCLVNFWHGLPLKSIEYDIASGPQARPYRNIFTKLRYRVTLLRKNDIVFNSSEFFEPKMLSSLRPDKIFNMGSPRLDILKKDPDKILTSLKQYGFHQTVKFIEGLAQYTKIYIYMPTFRDAGREWTEELNDCFSEINTYLKSTNACMIFKLHQNDTSLRSIALGHTNIILCDLDDAYPILPFTDCLISDYSSIVFDYMILKKQIILFPFDKKEYISSSRGLYFDYDTLFAELPQPQDTQSLIAVMREGNSDFSYPDLANKLGKVHMEDLCSEAIYNKIKKQPC